MKPYIIFITAAMAFCQTSLHAQSTPEAAIGQCPPLPSIEVMVEYGREISLNNSITKRMQEFMDKLNTHTRICDVAYQKASSDAEPDPDEVNKQTLALTGKTAKQLEGMSDAELEKMGQEMAAKEMNKVGAMTGLSVADLQKMENMTDEQIMAELQKSGAMDKMKASAAANASSSKKESDKSRRILEIQQELLKLNEQMSQTLSKLESGRNAINPWADDLWKRSYKAQADVAYTEYLGVMGVDTKVLKAKIEALLGKYYNEVCQRWQAQITHELDAYKILKSTADTVDKLVDESAMLTNPGLAKSVTGRRVAAWGIAMAYLRGTSAINAFPRQFPSDLNSKEKTNL